MKLHEITEHFPVCIYKVAKIGEEYKVRTAMRHSTRAKAHANLRGQFEALPEDRKAIKVGTQYFYSCPNYNIMLFVATADQLDTKKMIREYNKMEAAFNEKYPTL